MRYYTYMIRARGMSLVDVIVGVALILIIFVALVGILRTSLLVASSAKSKAMAAAIAESEIEYIRSLPYDSVGTVGGIPAGNVPQSATTTENGIAFSERTFIEYYDDPADGSGAGDTNGITTDYKRIKVTVYYSAGGKARQVDLISNYAPPSLETTTNGGTLKILVVNATGAAVPGASVRIQNASTSPTVDLTTFSDSTGTVFLPGATPSTGYQVTVSKNGYSSAQTYARDNTNQNPTPGYLTVVKNQTTTSTFAIDVLGTLTLQTYSPIASSTMTDTFTTGSALASLTSTTVSAGSVILLSGGGSTGYPLSGTAISTTTSPSYLSNWGTLSATLATPGGTGIKLHVLDGAGALIPDAVLSGNAAGFSAFPVSLYGISTSTYPTLALTSGFTTNATTTTPSLNDWTITYSAGPTPLPAVAFTLTGAKTIGTTGAGASIYKTAVASTTNSSGYLTQTLEWDSYKPTFTSYDVVSTCSTLPLPLSPGAALSASLILGPATANSALIFITDSSGNRVGGASVTLSRTGYTSTVSTNSCGAAYFGSLTSASDYAVSASKSGYTTVSASGVTVSGDIFYGLSF